MLNRVAEHSGRAWPRWGVSRASDRRKEARGERGRKLRRAWAAAEGGKETDCEGCKRNVRKQIVPENSVSHEDRRFEKSDLINKSEQPSSLSSQFCESTFNSKRARKPAFETGVRREEDRNCGSVQASAAYPEVLGSTCIELEWVCNGVAASRQVWLNIMWTSQKSRMSLENVSAMLAILTNFNMTCQIFAAKLRFREDLFKKFYLLKNTSSLNGSDHFESVTDYEDDMKNRLLGLKERKILKKNAVPSLNIPSYKAASDSNRDNRYQKRNIRKAALNHLQTLSPKKPRLEPSTGSSEYVNITQGFEETSVASEVHCLKCDERGKQIDLLKRKLFLPKYGIKYGFLPKYGIKYGLKIIKNDYVR
ncbi:hypothetical protein ANN_17861 [Periplaneta americana]|uniref:Uncharacterized protein n=1 Tax=Periplaneta americana TaxID=6978 RepID=A0ABQ8SVG6_PERAM|nr:hypothetical protein ANN_17861 [Periplaneta americana]